MIVSKLFKNNNHNHNPNGSLTNARNVIFDDNFLTLRNEDGFELLHTFDNDICGVIPTDKELIVLTTDSNGDDAIYRVDDGNSTLLLKGDLNLSTDYPVKGEYQYNNAGDLLFLINDTHNELRVFNADNPYMDLDPTTKEFVDVETGLNLLLLNPKYKVPNITNFSEVTGDFFNLPDLWIAPEDTSGSLPKGAYQIVLSYYIDDNDRLNWSIPSRVMFAHKSRNHSMVYSGNENEQGSHSADWIMFDDYFQNAAEDTTDKAFYITINNIDTSFSKYKLAMIHRTETSVKVYDMGDHNTSVISHHIKEPSNLELSLDEVTIPYVSYKTVQDTTISLDRLAAVNVTNKDVIDYQKYANNIKVTYNARAQSKTSIFGRYRLDIPTANYDEVYALNIGLIGKDSTVKGIFHIPGRAAKQGEDIYNCSKINTAADSEATDRYLSFYRNQNEYYPSTESFEVWDVDANGDGSKIGDIGGMNVRHHKMPSFQKIYKPTTYITGDPYLSLLTPMVITLDFTDIKFPKEILEEIQGFFICYSNRDSSNSTVLGYHPLIRNNFWKDYNPNLGTDGTSITGIGSLSELFGNYDFSSRVYRFNDTGLMINKPAIADGYLQPLCWADDTTTGQVFNSHKLINGIDLATDDQIEVLDYKYVPRDNSATEPSNKGREEALLLSVNKLVDDSEQYLICALKSNRQDVYTPFYDRRVSIASDLNFVTEGTYEYSVSNVRWFDSYFSYNTTLFYRGDQTLTLDEETKTITREDGDEDNDPTTIMESFTSFTVSTVNVSLKNSNTYSVDQEYVQDVPDIAFIWGDSDYAFTFRSNFPVDPSVDDGISYDRHFSYTNSVVPYYVFNHINALVAEHPFRVIRSAIQSKEALGVNWRYFSALEYYEMPKHRGVGKTIYGIDNMLLIHMEHSLYVAQAKDKISVPDGDAYIGTSDLFDRKPNELIPSQQGTAGIQSRFGYALSEFGYTFVDTYEKNIYNYSNNSVGRLTSINNLEFFKKYLNKSTGNPLTSSDVIVGIDHLKNRIIVTNLGSNPFTASYCYNENVLEFVSLHDYVPSLIANNRLGSYSVNSQNLKEIYKFNANTWGTYYDGTQYESYIDVLINESPQTDKILYSINMQSGVDDDANNISKVFFYNRNQCSKVYDILEMTNISDYDKIRFLEDAWHYDLIRDYSSDNIVQAIVNDFGTINNSAIDLTKNWYELGDIHGKFFIVRLITDNSSDMRFRDLGYNVSLNRR